MRIGIVDLDTSHPANWVPIERDLGHNVVGVWDEGTVHPTGYADMFAKEHDIPRVYPTLGAMVHDVDCAIIHSCNWDTHVDKARPFVEAGKSVLVDKPLAGNLRDLNQFRVWAAQDVRITGGSSLRFCKETQDWFAQPIAERGMPHTVICGCGVDEYNYGIHAYTLMSDIMGVGIRTVRHLGTGVQSRIWVEWDDGRSGLLVIGQAEAWLPFYATIITEKACAQYQATVDVLYRALLEATLPYLAGEVDQPPVPMEVLIEPELCALAARRSWLEEERAVAVSELTEADEGYDGQAFARRYRKAKSGS